MWPFFSLLLQASRLVKSASGASRFDISAVIFVALVFGHLGVKMPAILQKLGLIMFLAVVGTDAGKELAGTLQSDGFRYFVSGMTITLVPMILSITVGYYVFKMNFLSLIGSLTGSMTSTPALSAIEPMTDTNAPQIAYATVYPFALVLLIIVSQLLGSL